MRLRRAPDIGVVCNISEACFIGILGEVWVFVDDSGDCGFKFDGGSSTHLVIAACVFSSRTEIRRAIDMVHEARVVRTPDGREFLRNREFKYASAKDDHKDVFFNHVARARYHVRAIVLDKRLIRSSHLRDNPNDMKSYLIRQVLTHTLGTVRDAKLVIDGRDTRAFGMADRDYFMRVVNSKAPGTLIDVEYADSRTNNLVQLADMTAGSLRRAIEGHGPAINHRRSYERRFGYPHGSLWRFR